MGKGLSRRRHSTVPRGSVSDRRVTSRRRRRRAEVDEPKTRAQPVEGDWRPGRRTSAVGFAGQRCLARPIGSSIVRCQWTGEGQGLYRSSYNSANTRLVVFVKHIFTPSTFTKVSDFFSIFVLLSLCSYVRFPPLVSATHVAPRVPVFYFSQFLFARKFFFSSASFPYTRDNRSLHRPTSRLDLSCFSSGSSPTDNVSATRRLFWNPDFKWVRTKFAGLSDSEIFYTFTRHVIYHFFTWKT